MELEKRLGDSLSHWGRGGMRPRCQSPTEPELQSRTFMLSKALVTRPEITSGAPPTDSSDSAGHFPVHIWNICT
ncbi:unnamed protein product [Pleuronectes platessa]|uniref:Uncharacterized protein n=1 Tax=Pleuronectes platessa TaxID=8262 RepID=A0A9N7VXI7_PLEPL|nr:unnamed protein product [Pleuronectes platessa]